MDRILEEPEDSCKSEEFRGEFHRPPAVAQPPVGPVPRGLEDIGHDGTEEGGEEPQEYRARRDFFEEVDWIGIGDKCESPKEEVRLPPHDYSSSVLYRVY